MKKTLLLVVSAFVLMSCVCAQDRTDSIHIAHYDLHLSFTDFEACTLSGYAELSVVPKIAGLTCVTLDLKALTVDSVQVGGAAAAFSHAGERLHIGVPACTLGDTVAVRVFYHGTPVHDSSWGGFYYSGGYCYNMGVAFDDVPHNYGRVWFPCLDFFTDKSTYSMHIETGPGKMAVCNGLLADSAVLSDGNRLWTWNLDLPIPTYLATVAVGPYRLYADTFQGREAVIPIEIYAQPGSYGRVPGSFVHLKRILRHYEALFGPYRWPKVGYVLVNFTGGAMEHATSIAYPNAMVDGTTAYEQVYAHELFHHWFGNLVTCAQAGEMWLNEGFAAYSEALTDGLVNSTPAHDAYLQHIRALHARTLKNIVAADGGLYALDSVPMQVTYGIHSYDKGALVVHTLRHYMGDSLFFAACRAFLDRYSWQNVTSEQLFASFSETSGIDLTDFYEGWVHQPGFLQFHIDSIRKTGVAGHYKAYLHQKLYGAVRFANSNRVDLTFVSAGRQFFTVEGCMFSGEFGVVDVELPFEPLFGIVDLNSKMADAVIDCDFELTGPGSFTTDHLNCTVRASAVADTAWVRVEHSYVAPDVDGNLPEGICKVSGTHCWRVAVAANTQPQGQLRFKYASGGENSLDHSLMQGYAKENVKLLYRPDAASEWQVMPAVQSGSVYSGSLLTETMAPGEYCLGIGVPAAGIGEGRERQACLYPNPARGRVHIRLPATDDSPYKAVFADTAGRAVKAVRLHGGDNTVSLRGLPAGVYVVDIKGGLPARQTSLQLIVK